MPRTEDPLLDRSAPDRSAPDRHAGTPRRLYLVVAAPVALAVAAVVLQPWLRPTDLLRDAQAVAVAHDRASAAYGLVSNLGIVVVVLAAGAALLAWSVARRTDATLAAVLAWTSALSLALALDDLLLLHETTAIAPWSGAVVVAGYGVAFLAFAARFQGVIRRRLGTGLLVLAAAALATSALIDLLATPSQPTVVAEDGFKLLGLAAWSAFAVRAALIALRPHRATSAPGRDAAADPARPFATDGPAPSASEAGGPGR